MDDSIKRHATTASCRDEGQVTQRMIEAGGGGVRHIGVGSSFTS